MIRLLYLTSGHRDARPAQFVEDAAAKGVARIEPTDLCAVNYDALAAYGAVLVSMHVDQKYLSDHAERLEAYLHQGGVVVANGHHGYPFLPGLSPFRPIEGGGVAALTIQRAAEHPVWSGVNPVDLTFRRGVAGFYGRGWHEAPPSATVVHTIGRSAGPVDLDYRVGRGRVLFHGGNDLWQFGSADNTTARIVPQLLAWLVSVTAAT